MASAAGEPYIKIRVKCPKCGTEQIIHVRAKAGLRQIGDQTIVCLECKAHYETLLPDDIIGGPFPA